MNLYRSLSQSFSVKMTLKIWFQTNRYQNIFRNSTGNNFEDFLGIYLQIPPLTILLISPDITKKTP